jgi:hypothetical protein
MIKKKQRRLVFSILILTAVSCNNGSSVGDKERVELKNFSFQLPSFVKSQPVIHQNDDGDNGSIIIKELDTILFNFGYDIDNLSEKDPAVIYYPYNEDSIRSKLDTSLVDPKKIVYTKKPNFDIDEFRKQNVYFEAVSGYTAKITVPRQIEKGGITGMYVDSLRKDPGGRLKFNFYTKDLDSLKNDELLKIIRSIQFNLK